MIHVAVGVLINTARQILVAQRPRSADHGGLWEFPGGKVESGEGVYQALCRELKEEIDIDVLSAAPLTKIHYDYDRYSVLLDTWIVDTFDGKARGVEGQVVRWISLSELQTLTMPKANDQIVLMLNEKWLDTATT